MKYILNFSILIVAFILVSCGDGGNKKNGKKDNQPIDDYTAKIDSLILTTSPRKFNGVILITQNGKTKYSKTYGFSNFEENIPITLEDNFRIQSNSKQITAVLILKEVETGRINLDRPVSNYLPGFEQSWVDSVTVHHLLNMSSGIISLDKPLIFEPGTAYKYSNAAYGLLGRILSHVTGKKYVDLANGLFKELGMNNTYCYEFENRQNNLINGYTLVENGNRLEDFYTRGITPEGWVDFIPAGGIISNAYDLNTWDIRLHNGDLLTPESYKKMISYTIKGQHAAFGREEIGYGYGVRIDDNESIKIIGHAGKGIGFTNTKIYVPKKELNIIVLENIYDEDPSVVYHFEKAIKEIVMQSSLVR